MSKYHILIDKFLKRTITEDERFVLKKWVLKEKSNMDFFKKSIKNTHKKQLSSFDSDIAFKKFSNQIKLKNKTSKLLPVILKYAAVVALLGTIIGYYINSQYTPPKEIVKNTPKIKNKNDITIKLADGSYRTINTENNEVLKDVNGNIIAKKNNSLLSYEKNNTETLLEPIFNEIYVPHGQTFKLKLADGTLVWLNSGSRLRFPQSFLNKSNNRMVYLDGEAFFDVTKNNKKPFIVNAQEIAIKVLGTKFNVSSYKMDNSIATTLVEGAVNLYETKTIENKLQLSPNYQASYNKLKNNFSKEKVDVAIYTSWMHNKLIIDNLPFSKILTKLERIHNVKFINKATHLNQQIYAGEFTKESINDILKTIALSTPFKYEINNNIITITQ